MHCTLHGHTTAQKVRVSDVRDAAQATQVGLLSPTATATKTVAVFIEGAFMT